MKIVIIGAGMAAVRLADRLTRERPELQITLVNGEGTLPYNRVLLSDVLATHARADEIRLHPVAWYEESGIEVRPGWARRIDLASKRVELVSGESIGYDRLVLATGSRPVMPDVTGALSGKVIGFRSLRDCDSISGRVSAGARVVVLGGGLLGLEAAAAIRTLGASVSVVHRGGWLMNRQLDEAAGRFLQQEICARGIDVRLGETMTMSAGDCVLGGRPVEADLIVAASGIVPNTDLAAASGLRIDRGICVDANFETSQPYIHAIGECCEYEGSGFGLLAPIWDQVDQLTKHLLTGRQFASFDSGPHAVRLKVSDLDVHVMGRQPAGADVIRFEDARHRQFRALAVDNGTFVGATLIGDLTHSQVLQQQLGGKVSHPRDLIELQFTGKFQAPLTEAA